MYTQQQRQAMIDRLAHLPAQLEALVWNLSEDELFTHYLAGEWSVAQIVHHLADSHMNSFIRLKRLLTEEQPPLLPYDQDAWALRADADQVSIQVSLLLLRCLHRRWVILFESLQEDEWLRTGLHPTIGSISIEDLLRSYAEHGENHLAQITKTLTAHQ
ncbi:MAG: DinB family protein [Caldilineaceae bacterium]